MADLLAAKLNRLADDLLKSAQTQQAVRVRRALIATTADAPAVIRQSALDTLPHGGGANRWVADATTKVITSGGVRSAGVTVRTRKTGHDLKSVDAGVLRHPNWNHPNSWSVTRVRPGFFTRPLRERVTPVVTAAMRAELKASARTVTGG